MLSVLETPHSWFKAVQSWDYRRVKEILQKPPELLAATNPKGLNALHMACAVRHGKPGLHEQNGIETVSTKSLPRIGGLL